MKKIIMVLLVALLFFGAAMNAVKFTVKADPGDVVCPLPIDSCPLNS
jgi:hypothetical protein